LEQNLRWPDLRGGQEKDILKARLETYNLSVTHLLNFLDLTKGGPEYFKQRNLLNLPEVKSASLSYGTAIHAAMDAAQKLTNRRAFSLAKVSAEFQAALRAEQLPAEQYKRYSSQGKRELLRLFKDLGYKLPKGSPSEQKFRDVMVGQARLGGKLDRVDNNGERISIIDYKTGRPLKSFDTNDKSLQLKAYKHKLQLVFYSLLLGEQNLPVEGQMVYVEAQNQRELLRTYQPTPEDIQRLKRMISVIWPMIINLNLPDTSAYSPDFDGIKSFEADLLK
ncbi:MAG TPA: PD-(D/E)XK nuclease family protein, partial [Candidatus Nitrosopolaris sp.]|nr:PD-(D/E)XK nuclease family protein [Candidatus Nitrosopolaris sp.]